MRAQLNYKISKLFSVLGHTKSLPEPDQTPTKPKFLVYIFKSMLNFNFEVFPISAINSIRMRGTILTPPSQSILFTTCDCQLHTIMVRINVNKVTILFNCKNPG